MTNATSVQQPAPVQDRRAILLRFQEQACVQLFACLAHAGRRDKLEAYSGSGANLSTTTEHLYHLALVLAREGEMDQALALLRKVLAEDSNHRPTRRLAYRLLVHRAKTEAGEANWEMLSDLIVEATQVCPEGENPVVDFAGFRSVLPMSHLRAGQREESARLWEQQLIENAHDPFVLHNLALMHYWWACNAEQSGNGLSLARFWRPAIIYWSLLQQVDSFWNAWRDNRKEVWGFSISDEDLDELRKRLIVERFDYAFQNRLDDAKQKGQLDIADQYEECLNVALLERRSAQYWKSALGLLARSHGAAKRNIERPGVRATAGAASSSSAHPHSEMLRLPGGVGFFKNNDLLAEIAQVALELSAVPGAEDCALHLWIFFSPDNLGCVLVLIEDRALPAEATSLLDQLPPDLQASKEGLYLRTLALRCRAEQLFSRNSYSAAFECLKTAFQQLGAALGSTGATARSSLSGSGSDGTTDAQALSRLFTPRLDSLRTSIQSQVISGALKEATRLKTAGKLNDAIVCLQDASQLDKDGVLLDHLCIYLCERAGERLGQEKVADARRDFTRVLQLKPAYDRAKRGMATTYNNEACAEQDNDKSIALFEKALEFEPDSHAIKRNLARELRSKAVKRVNSSSKYGVRSAVDDAIRLLERSFDLVNNELKRDALELIKQFAEFDSTMTNVTKQIEDDVLKAVVEDLGTVYHMRASIRRGY